jgi:hypothetical protein
MAVPAPAEKISDDHKKIMEHLRISRLGPLGEALARSPVVVTVSSMREPMNRNLNTSMFSKLVDGMIELEACRK